MNIDVDPDWGEPANDQPLASGNGAGPLGFAGTVRNGAVEQAAGLTTLAADEFGGGPTMPMMPGSWEPDGHPSELWRQDD
jgi:PPE-repeat protein